MLKVSLCIYLELAEKSQNIMGEAYDGVVKGGK
jgi:hypothetical protein